MVAVYVKNLPVFTFFGRVFASPIGLILIAATFIGACAFVYIPEIVHALRDDDKAENEKDAEIRRRIDEEVERLKQEDEKRRRDGE